MQACSPERTVIRLVGALAAFLVAAALSPAHAVTVGPTSVLPGAISFEYFGVNFVDNLQTSDTVGTLNYGGHPGCGGNCFATTALGGSPHVSATMNEVVFEHTSGGIVEAKLGYYVAYLNAPGTYNVNLHATDALSSPDGAAMSASLSFGPSDAVPGNFNDFASKTFEEAECLVRCPAPGFAFPAGPIVTDHLVSMEANTLYFIRLDVLLNPGPSNVEVSASLDPTFSTSASGGQFIFSPGVTSAVTPLPAALPLFISSLGGLGLVGWRRNQKAASAA
jgi:hypothetical protein